ncbi:helix-turn-helix domain-containing protein [Embleya sp. NPDC059237]|uniref:helix-turn-helix domain-containing protein n=1 Tax=Embleya sp. NPDC059237 TaxID=3346784 RepID=UPI0036BF3D25
MPENTRTHSAERLCTILADTASRDGFTARALSEATGLGRSTVTKLLAHLEAEGAVYRENPPRVNGRPQPASWHLTRVVTTAAANTDAIPHSNAAAGCTVAPEAAADTEMPAPDDATPHIPQTPATDDSNPTDAGNTPAHADAPVFGRTGEDSDPPGRFDKATRADAPASAEPSAGDRLRPGALRDLVRAHLHDRPTKQYTPGEIARVLGRSSGAVANTLVALAAHGDAILSCPKPRRYRAAPRDAGTPAS